MTDKMPTWSRLVVSAKEFHDAIRAITAFPNTKPEAYNVIQFILEDGELILCAANINQMARVHVGTYFQHVEDGDRVFEVTNPAAKMFLKVKPDMSDEVDAKFSIEVKRNEVIVKDESGTCGDLTEVTANRIAPSLPADVLKVLGKVTEELADGVDAAHRALLTPAQAGALSTAGRWLGAEYIDPIGLEKHQHQSRVYISLRGIFEAYSYVPSGADAGQETIPGIEDTGIATDVDGLVYDDVVPAPAAIGRLKVVEANPAGGMA